MYLKSCLSKKKRTKFLYKIPYIRFQTVYKYLQRAWRGSIARYRLSGSIQLDCISPREGMPEYISRYINLSASRWFPRRIQEVISGTSMRSPVGSLAACARALSREKERERVPEAAGMAVPRINRVQSERVLSVEWQRERRECTRGRKTIRGRRWNKKERERDSRAGCGTRPRGGDSRLVNAIAVERGGRREEKVQVSCVEALESRVAFEFFTWLANSSPPLLALSPSQSRDHTLACAGKHPRCISLFNRSRLSFTRFSPPGFRCNFFLSAVLKRVVLSRGCFFIDRSSFRSVDTRWRNKGRLNNGWIGERERERGIDARHTCYGNVCGTIILSCFCASTEGHA